MGPVVEQEAPAARVRRPELLAESAPAEQEVQAWPVRAQVRQAPALVRA